MATKFRLVAEIFDPRTDMVINRTLITEKEIVAPKNIMELGFNHQEQIDLLKKAQDSFLSNQSNFLREPLDRCPNCSTKLQKHGFKKSDFHSVFTDHAVNVGRLKCSKCLWRSVPSVQSLFGTSIHPDLTKIQCELAAQHSYPEAANILEKQSNGYRKINNHDRIRHNVSLIGSGITTVHQETKNPICEQSAEELIIKVDGGHVTDKNPNKQSFEALTAIVYQPKNVRTNPETDTGKILDKSCAASALNDGQIFMKEATLWAAVEQGMDQNTHITALCDGAANCWNVVDALEAKAASITRILDWFHIGMKFKNLSSPSELSQEKIKKAKWSLWHGGVENSVLRLKELIEITTENKEIIKIKRLITYIQNNKDYIVDYEDRKNKGLVFTSHMAEATVESLINQRCKAKQHMSWTREGLHALLQIKSAILSTNRWVKNAMPYIFKGLNISPEISKIV